MDISRLEKFHSTVFFFNFAQAFRFCCCMKFCIKKVGSPDQFLRYKFRANGIFSVRCTRKLKFRLCKIGKKTHKLSSYSSEPRTGAWCFRLNFNISKLVYWPALSQSIVSPIIMIKTTWTKYNLQVHSHLLLSEERHPRKSEVMSVYKHILDKQVWRAAMLLKQTQFWFMKQIWRAALLLKRTHWIWFINTGLASSYAVETKTILVCETGLAGSPVAIKTY